jgi:hypothetical protein
MAIIGGIPYFRTKPNDQTCLKGSPEMRQATQNPGWRELR